MLFVQTPRDLRVEFFATDLSDYVTGVVIPIDAQRLRRVTVRVPEDRAEELRKHRTSAVAR